LRKESRSVCWRDGAVLEAALWKHGHLEPEHRSHAAGYDLALQSVQPLVRSLSELGERNGFGHGYDRWPRARAERVKPVLARACEAPHARSAVASAVCQRMLDRLHTPTLLVQHAVVDDASNRELAVRLDGIVLEVLVSAVAVDEQPPLRVALPDGAEQREIRRGALDVERLVVLDHRDGAQRIERRRRHLDHFAEHLELDAREELGRLIGVLAGT